MSKFIFDKRKLFKNFDEKQEVYFPEKSRRNNVRG